MAARLAEDTSRSESDDEQDHDDGEQLSMSMSHSDVKRSVQGGQGETLTCAAPFAGVRTDPESTARRLTRSKVGKTLDDRCLFCQQARKKVKGVHQTLTSCMTFEACDAIYNAAYVRGDERVLLEVQPGQPDLIAKEISYHRVCYMKYTHPFYLQGISEAKVREESGGERGSVYAKAFSQLASEIQRTILDNPGDGKFVSMPDLCEQYVTALNEQGLSDIHSYRADRLKLRLQQHFGEQVVFFRSAKRVTDPELVTAKSIPRQLLLEHAAEMMHATTCKLPEADDLDIELANLAEPGDNHPQVSSCSATEDIASVELFNSALYLRRQLLALKSSIPPTPTAEDLLNDSAAVPNVLYNFLAWVFCGDKANGPAESEITAAGEKVTVERDETHRHIMSVAQDVVHITTQGRVRTPKHFMLPLTVQHLTRSSQLVTMLNRLGHGYSASRIEEYETAIAERFLATVGPDGVFVPSNINRTQPVVFCWDNNDLQEETLSGGGTTHCTNGIVIQRRSPAESFSSVNEQQIPSFPVKRPRHRRSIQCTAVQELHYVAGSRAGPARGEHHYVADSDSLCLDQARQADQLYMLLRCPRDCSLRLGRSEGTPQAVSPWSAFNASVTDVPQRSTVGYLPVIPSSPTELATVHEAMTRSCAIATALNQEHVIITVDQAIYCKAQEIRWKHPSKFQNVVLRMGAFHTATAFLAVLGKRFGDAGLQDLLVESGIVAAGSVQAVLSGRHYNRGIRAHKILWEALSRLRWASFEVFLDGDGAGCPVDFQKIAKALEELRSSPTKDKLSSLSSMEGTKTFLAAFDGFCTEQNAQSPLFAFWSSYLQTVELLLAFLRATCEGNWNLHVACLRKLLPWFYAYDRVNYARYMTVYWSEMENLRNSHPAAYDELKRGGFVVQRSENNAFAQVAVVQAIEQTMNRDSTTHGGIVGFSLRPSAQQRWVLTHHERAAITHVCRHQTALDGSTSRHHESGPTARQRQEDAVAGVVSLLRSWRDPFQADGSGDLINIASGVAATNAVRDDLLSAVEKGESALKDFINQRLAQGSTLNFYDKLHQMQLNTFSSMLKCSAVKVDKVNMVLKADRGLFARMVVMAQTRLLNLRQVLTFELGPLPWSLATPDGSPCKTQKSKLLALLEGDIQPEEDVPVTAAVIVDAMATLQALTSPPATFGELAQQVFTTITKSLTTPRCRVDFVIDRYPLVSIKTDERLRRLREHGCIRVHILSASQKIPIQWKKFLSNSQNKENLLHFLVQEWSSRPYAATRLSAGGSLFVTDGMTCYQLTCNRDGQLLKQVVPELKSSHEEADTRLILHAAHAGRSGHECIIIKSPDTDVAVLATAHSAQIHGTVLFLTGTKQRRRYVNISKVAAELGPSVCRALLGYHALSGCDSVSAFVGKGKALGFRLLIASPAIQEHLQMLGQEFRPNFNQLAQSCEAVVCSWYGYPGANNINDVRYAMFCCKAGDSSQLPPTQNALQEHVHRANYQAAVWHRALEAEPDIPHPASHGWIVDQNGHLCVQWMTQPPAPRDLLNLMSCKCRTSCCTRRCSCFRGNLPCTDVCGCTGCENTGHSTEVAAGDSGSDCEEDQG